MRLLVLTFVILCFGPVGGQERYAVIIQEIMPDPSPAVGLPSPEWIEIRNRGNATVNLQGWRIHDTNGSSGVMPARILEPDSILIICGISGLPLLSAYGPAIAVTSFPSLDNEGELLSLTDASGNVIHAVHYDPGWHTNALKRDGGWSLEMIDSRFACSMKGNWVSSIHPAGGTPGRTNSVSGEIQSPDLPLASRLYTPDSVTLRILFTGPVDSLQATAVAGYHIEGLPILGAIPVGPLFDQVQLNLGGTILSAVVYWLNINGQVSCDGRVTEPAVLRFGLPSDPPPGSLLINEVLFNPVSSGYDYVELLNTGPSLIDPSRYRIGNRNSQGEMDNLVPLSPRPGLWFPGDYYVVTPDPNRLALHYFSPPGSEIITLPSMPSFPDDKGAVLLTDAQGNLLDELRYSEKWHFPLVRDREGVSLERIDSLAPASDPHNWRSAASTVGYGTPGYRNSQVAPDAAGGGMVSIRPGVFSPDNDGRDDQCFIFYELPDAGYVADLSIFNLHGRLVRRLKQGNLLAASGFWTWDGLDEKGRANPPGPYIILTSVFNLEGRTRKWKSVVVLAR